MDPLLVTTREAAALLGVGRPKIYQLINEGRLPSARIGGSRRIPAQALRDYVSALTAAAPSTDDDSSTDPQRATDAADRHASLGASRHVGWATPRR